MGIKHLAAEGLSTSRIARRLGIDRVTVAKYLTTDSIPAQIQRKPISL